MTIDQFSTIWIVDVDSKSAALNGLDAPTYLTAKDVYTGHQLRLDSVALDSLNSAPYDCSSSSLLVMYGAEPTLAHHIRRGWPLPVHVLDLSVEFSNLVNGRVKVAPRNLAPALSYFGLNLGKSVQRYAAWDIGHCMTFGPDHLNFWRAYTDDAISGMELLLEKMIGLIALPFALHRGNFLKVAVDVQACGVPLDGGMLSDLKKALPRLKAKLIDDADTLGLFENGKLSRDHIGRWSAERRVQWPQLEKSKILRIDIETLGEQCKRHPDLTPTFELQRALVAMADIQLEVDQDGRSRQSVCPFSSKTSRNQPSSNRFVFSASSWLRPLVTPSEAYRLVELDWSQQEFGIAAALSGDKAMQEAYNSGDPYLAFAKQAGAAPPDATKATHSVIREQFKECALGVLYGMGPSLLSKRIGQSSSAAKNLLLAHRRTYPTFWEWSDKTVDYVVAHGELQTVFGWQQKFLDIHRREPSIRNFPMQANGAEMMRTAAVLMAQAGVKICAIIHDGFVIEAPTAQANEAEGRAEEAMKQASAIVLDGFELRSEAQRIEWGCRYKPKKGQRLWDKIQGLLPLVSQHANPQTGLPLSLTVGAMLEGAE